MADEAAASSAYSSGMRGREKPEKGGLRRIEIEAAKGGVTVSCDYDRRNKKGEPMFFEPRIPTVFTDRAALHAFVDEELDAAGVLKAGGEKKQEKAEGETA